MRAIMRLVGARQAGYGIVTDRPLAFETLRESFGEVDLSVEYGRPAEQVGELPDDASTETRWNALARLEAWPATWAEQEAVREADRIADGY